MKANVDQPLPKSARRILALLSSLALVSSWNAASAGDFEVHGFGTIGTAYVDKPAGWAYARSLNQRVNDDKFRLDLDSVVGVQINYQPSPTFEVVAQAAVSRLDGDAEHNDYLELLSSGGLIGFAIGVWFAAVVIREARRNFSLDGSSYLRLGAILGIIGVAAHSLVDFGLHILINAIVFLSLIMIATNRSNNAHAIH